MQNMWPRGAGTLFWEAHNVIEGDKKLTVT